jgi:hypothetical protein
MTTTVSENKIWNNPGPIMDYRIDSNLDNYNYDAKIYIKNNSVYDCPYAIFKTYGDIAVTDNYFENCDGYVIELEYLYMAPPIIVGNTIVNCENVYYVSGKQKGDLRLAFTMADLDVDCTGNAFYFRSVDVTLKNVTVADRATPAIIAEDAFVDAILSKIKPGSGEVYGAGAINVWFNIEIWITWADAMGVDSGQPADDALVVLFASSGEYFSSDYTDSMGHLKPIRYPQWSIRGAFYSLWTPYTITVAKAGATSNQSIDLDRDYIGEDAVRFLLVDKYVPTITITSPFEDDVFSTDSLTVKGFTYEVGSGVKHIMVSYEVVGQNETDPVDILYDEDGNFEHTFTEIPEGTLRLHARVSDIALNVNQTMISVIIDRTPPNLEVNEPLENATTNVADIPIDVSYEAGAMLLINGVEVIGIDGVFTSTHRLAEGANLIVVEAIDVAGNSQVVSRNVTLDRFPPPLVVLSPRDGVMTNIEDILIEGDVEVGATLTVSINPPSGAAEEIEVRPDGTFSHVLTLDEGENIIHIEAVDYATNVALVTRTVVLDTTEPECAILSPADGTITNVATITVQGTADPTATLILNGKQIHNPGTFSSVVSLNEGTNVIELLAVDAIGNENPITVTVTLDTVPPVIQMTRPLEAMTTTNNPELQLAGVVTGGALKLWVLDVEVPVSGDPSSFDVTRTLPQEGLIEVEIVAMDLAGNKATHIVMVDFSTQMPPIVVTFNPPGVSVKAEDSNLYIYGSTAPGVLMVEVIHTVGGETFNETYTIDPEGQFTIARPMSEGENSIVVRIVDKYGNFNTTTAHVVDYTYKGPEDPKEDEILVNPQDVSLAIVAIAAALAATALFVAWSFKRRREEQ